MGVKAEAQVGPSDSTWPAVELGVQALLECQWVVSRNVPRALDASRETITTYAYGLTEEIHELVREIGWKPWKTASPPNVDRVVEEYADLLAFLGILSANLAERCSMTPAEFAAAVADQYRRTSSRNIGRFTNGQEPA